MSSGRQAGITPNLLITHLWKIAPPPIVLHEPCPLMAAKNSMHVNLEGAEMCIIFQYSLTATGTCMQFTRMHHVHS